MATKKTRDAMEIIKRRFGIDPRRDPKVQAFAEDFRIAQVIYDARKTAGMTQKELARAIGTTQSVISQLEDADYRGHSMSMLRRIASALGMRVEMRLVPEARRKQRA
jgi:ribosome-binding protein aMBF1 (putative translation factor)